MANTFKYMYSNPVANKLPGSDTNYNFRTVTRYEVDANGKPTGKSTSQLYYTPVPGGRTTGGDTWTSGNEKGENFDSAGYALAAESTDGGATWTPKQYTQEDADVLSAIGDDKVGQNVLGATALQSLQTPGGRFYETAQNSIINTAVKTQPNLAASVSSKLKNAAEESGETPPAGDQPDTQPQLTDEQQREAASKPAEALDLKVGSSKGTRSEGFGDYIYPLDLGVSTQDVIKFTMLEYVPTDINMSSGTFGIDSSARQEKRTSLGTVILPIPGGIQDNNSVSWSGQNMNALEIAAANFALNTIQSGVEGATAATKNIVNAVVGGSDATKTAIGTILAGQAAGVGQQLVTRTTGAVINPNLELLFSGPSLRQFSFKFKLTPRESSEAKEIAKIIRFFKQGSAVQRTEANLFLKSPHTFQIQYLYRGPKGGENPFMNKIKECACTGVSVSYTPENNYATFSDGAMTSYELTLAFGELEPIFNDDYGNDATFPSEIGY